MVPDPGCTTLNRRWCGGKERTFARLWGEGEDLLLALSCGLRLSFFLSIGVATSFLWYWRSCSSFSRFLPRPLSSSLYLLRLQGVAEDCDDEGREPWSQCPHLLLCPSFMWWHQEQNQPSQSLRRTSDALPLASILPRSFCSLFWPSFAGNTWNLCLP